MGYLDHSTNNIILDAVLTDYGRQRLATANSAFNVSYYSLGDDEIDYGIIKKYGRTVGKEKIEKNTPIFEALTNPSIALKYKLIGRETDGTSLSSVYLPVLSSTPSTADLIQGSKSSVTIRVDLSYNRSTGTGVPPQFAQGMYKIKVPDRFYYIDGAVGGTLTSPDIAQNLINAGDPNRIATYTFTTTNSSTTSISFNVKYKNIDNTTLSIYGKRTSTTSNARLITSYITVIGERHGCSVDIPVTYSATTT